MFVRDGSQSFEGLQIARSSSSAPRPRYSVAYRSNNSATATTMELDATDDRAAKAELRSIVAQGYRNECCASMVLASGRLYVVSNAHGKAVGRTI